MQELQQGLWWWEAVHPQWTPGHDAAGLDWGPDVSAYAIDDGQRLLLIDPTTPPSPVGELGAGRQTSSVLSCHCHASSSRRLVDLFGATISAPPTDEGDTCRLES